MITPIYQKQGSSSHILAQQYGEMIGEKATHTGTLDPMAEGVLIVLTGEDRFKKEDLSNVKKTYVFEVLVGFTTDSHDLLGLVERSQMSTVSKEDMKQSLSSFEGVFSQRQPNFSAKRINGKSLFDLAKEKKKVDDYYNQVTLYATELMSTYTIENAKLLEKIQEKIANVQGDFRQQQVVASWTRYLKDQKKSYQIFQIEVETSKRFYIRGLVRDLSQKLHTPLTTLSIKRTKNGTYSLSDCIEFSL